MFYLYRDGRKQVTVNAAPAGSEWVPQIVKICLLNVPIFQCQGHIVVYIQTEEYASESSTGCAGMFLFFFQSTAQLQYVEDSEPVTRST